VKYWIHELHFKKFGNVIGEKPIDFTPAEPEDFCEGPAPIYRQESWLCEGASDKSLDDDGDVQF